MVIFMRFSSEQSVTCAQAGAFASRRQMADVFVCQLACSLPLIERERGPKQIVPLVSLGRRGLRNLPGDNHTITDTGEKSRNHSFLVVASVCTRKLRWNRSKSCY